ncbi:MAG TPA: hypothetical protein VMQ76_09405 [Terracidiphilus sp.]|nr:hypothetical protein [Terracidiphilus sp.]
MKRKTPMKRRGKRTILREKMNAKVNILWEQLGINSCEIRLQNCMGRFGLSHAHSRKSRDLRTESDWMECAAACSWCHHILDFEMSHDQMYKAVTDAIARRQPTERGLEGTPGAGAKAAAESFPLQLTRK